MNRVRNTLQIGRIQNFFSKKRFRTPGKGESMTKENEEKKHQKAESVSEGSKNETYYESFELIARKANRNYKDTLFRFIFSDKEKLL